MKKATPEEEGTARPTRPVPNPPNLNSQPSIPTEEGPAHPTRPVPSPPYLNSQQSTPCVNAPTPPKIPSVTFNTTLKSPTLKRTETLSPNSGTINKINVNRTQSAKQMTLQNALHTANATSISPALPPPNCVQSSRPTISSPILENSTCTAKELMSPLRNVPKAPLRPAPEVPPAKQEKRPLSSPDAVINSMVSGVEEIKKPQKEKTLNRIASFLKSVDKKPQIHLGGTNTLPGKASKVLNKDALRSMEISKPIPQSEIEVANALPVDSEETKAVVMRAQSMRGKL